MSARRDPVARIMDGLLHALARYGVQRISMTDIAVEAGISRGTLYRYFSTKDEVLAALGTHVLDDFRASLKQVVDAAPSPTERVPTVLRMMASFIGERPSLERLANAEPGFVIAFFRTNAAEIVHAIEDAIAPAFTGDPNRRRRNRNVALVSELTFRIMLSYQFSGRDGESVSTDQIAAVLQAFVDSQSTR